jgi:hypothetical protein
MSDKKLKPEKKEIPTRAPQKKTSAGIFDNIRQPELHPVDDYTSAIPESNIADLTIPDLTIPKTTIPDSSIVKSNRQHPSRGKVKAPKATAAALVPAINLNRGFLQIFNDIVDHVFPTLPPAEQVVLLRLYRESRGRKQNTVTVGYGRIGVWCNMSRSAAQAAIATLLDSGFIEKQGDSREGSTYKVNLPGVTPRTIPEFTIPESSIVNSGIVKKTPTLLKSSSILDSGIPESNHMKIKNKEHEIKEHTQTQLGVGVGSLFSLEECRHYAEHLKTTGQGITNPGGYATKIFRSGEADALVEAFINSAKPVDINQCPDCRGMGVYYPNGIGQGPVVKCKHEKLRA